MQYVNLGKSGLKVSRICLGMMSYGDPNDLKWSLPEDQARPIVQRAVESGINFFDTADVYSHGASEVITGHLLKAFFSRRDEYVVATKVYNPMGEAPNQYGLSRKHIMDSIDDSLKRLGMDHVDLYQIHRWDDTTPIEETMEALHDVVKAGKARYIGASSMWTWQFAKAQYTADLHGWTRFVSMQNHYNLAYREEEREMIPFCIDQGVGVIPWSPIARGFLAGNRVRNQPGNTTRSEEDRKSHWLYDSDADWETLDRCIAVGKRLGVSSAQVALGWMLHQPGITSPIIGATKLSHLEDAIGALDVALTDEDIAWLEAPYVPKEVKW
jgi:aryl-alcohol dehydrogenase-like predicted oxidoreductase